MNWLQRARKALPWHGLDPQARRALLCHGLYWQAMAVGNTFANIYIYRLTQGFAKPALFQLVTNACIPLGFALGSWMARTRSSAFTFRAGLVAMVGYLCLLLALRERCVDHLLPLGLALGLAGGIYWQAWNLLLFDLSDDRTRGPMLGTQQVSYFMQGLVAAPLVGWYLAHAEDLDAYLKAFGAATLLLLAACWLSRPIVTKPLHGAGAVWRLARIRKSPAWRAVNISSAAMGFVSVSAMFLSFLLAFEAKGDESGAGDFAWVNAACGVAGAWFVGRNVDPGSRLKSIWLSSLAVAAVTLPLAFDRSFALVLLYGAGMAVSMSFYNIPLTATYLKVIGSHPRFHHRRADTLTIRELYINAGRVVGYAFIIALVGGLESSYLGIFFVATAAVQILNVWVVRRYV